MLGFRSDSDLSLKFQSSGCCYAIRGNKLTKKLAVGVGAGKKTNRAGWNFSSLVPGTQVKTGDGVRAKRDSGLCSELESVANASDRSLFEN